MCTDVWEQRSVMVEGEPKLKISKREEIYVKKRSQKNEIVMYGADTEKRMWIWQQRKMQMFM